MNYYHMNMNENYEVISRTGTQISEYQAEIDAWLLKGNIVKQIPRGHRTTESKIPSYNTTKEEKNKASLMRGHSLFDQIELNKGKEYNLTIEDLFNNPEQF